MEDELVEFHFEPDVTSARSSRSSRCSASPRQRRVFVAALGVSLLAHGALLGAAAIVLYRHARRAPSAGIVRGDQGGNASADLSAGQAVESPPSPPLPPSLPVVPMATMLPAAIDLPFTEQADDLDDAQPEIAGIESNSAIASVEASGLAGTAIPPERPFGLPQDDHAGSSPPPRATPSPAPIVRPPRVARGSGLGDTIGVHGDPLGLDSRGLPVPEYPSESRRRGEQGLVELDVEVLADGLVGTVRIATGSGYPRLDESALTAAQKATFEPATCDGQPTVAHVTIPYRFVLR